MRSSLVRHPRGRSTIAFGISNLPRDGAAGVDLSHCSGTARRVRLSVMNDAIRPILTGSKALVVGIANDQSIAYGCAKAFRSAGRKLP